MRQRNETRKARGRCSLKQVVHHSAKLPALEARVFRALSHLSPMLRRKAWESASRLIIDCDKCDWPVCFRKAAASAISLPTSGKRRQATLRRPSCPTLRAAMLWAATFVQPILPKFAAPAYFWLGTSVTSRRMSFESLPRLAVAHGANKSELQ